MKDYIIFTDSTSDLPLNIIKELGIKVIPMSFSLNDKNYVHYPDERELDIHEFYEKLRKGEKATTTQINIRNYMENFEPAVKDGKDILYISFSSGLSSTYNASLLVAEEMMRKYPECAIICVDSRAASLGEGLLVYTAAKKKEEGIGIVELRDWILSNRSHLCHWFTVDDLNHLKNGGRVTTMTAVVGTALNIKPVLHVDDEGHLIPVSRVRGRKKSLGMLVENMLEFCVNPEEQTIFIGHGDCLEDAKLLESLVRENFNVKEIIINNIGPIIGTHSGPGTIALFFYGIKKKVDLKSALSEEQHIQHVGHKPNPIYYKCYLKGG